jgi:periplasmic protein TonB
MNSSIADQLEEAISSRMASIQCSSHHSDTRIEQLLAVAEEVRYLPRPEFRARLLSELQATANDRALNGPLDVPAPPRQRGSRESVVPLFSTGSGAFPVRGSHLALSFALHVAALSLVVTSGWWMVENRAVVRKTVAELIPGDAYALPVAPGVSYGGGGGGDNDKIQASHGSAPRFAAEQLTPPAVVVRNEDPKLPTEPSVVGPPDLVLPQSVQPGDPMAAILTPPSNGVGSGGGIGSGHGGGLGGGEGPGVGEGRGGGIGGGVFRVGGGVSAPRAIYAPDPEFSEEARKAKYQGSVVLSAIIGPDGRPHNLRVVRSLGMGLDEKATEAVTRWRFEPAHKGSQPVAVDVNIEVAFRLY